MSRKSTNYIKIIKIGKRNYKREKEEKMNLSKKSRYGLTALIDLSIHSTKGHVSLISIAERNGISPQYLEHIFASLRRAGIIKSIKRCSGRIFTWGQPFTNYSGINYRSFRWCIQN